MASGQYHIAVASGSVDCRLSIADFRSASDDKANWQSAIGNRQSWPGVSTPGKRRLGLATPESMAQIVATRRNHPTRLLLPALKRQAKVMSTLRVEQLARALDFHFGHSTWGSARFIEGLLPPATRVGKTLSDTFRSSYVR